jgi:DHA1 family multidrug resistance protein B-like MFS transporter
VAQTFMQLDLLMAVYVTDKLPEQTLFTIGDWSFSLNGKEAFSWVVSENGLLVALFTVFMTKWMTRYKERNVFVMSAVFYGVGIFIYGHTLNIWILFFAGAIFTAAELMVAGLQNDFISKLAPEHMRGQYFAAASLRFSIGRTIAPLAIPLTAWIGYSWTFTLLAIVAFVGAALYALMFELFERKKREAGEWKDARSS